MEWERERERFGETNSNVTLSIEETVGTPHSYLIKQNNYSTTTMKIRDDNDEIKKIKSS